MTQVHMESKGMMVRPGSRERWVARVLLVRLGFRVIWDPKAIEQLNELCRENQERKGNLVVMVCKAYQVLMEELVLLDQRGYRVYLGYQDPGAMTVTQGGMDLMEP